jgi:hypothetical protein
MSNDDPVFLSAFIEYLENNFYQEKKRRLFRVKKTIINFNDFLI